MTDEEGGPSGPAARTVPGNRTRVLLVDDDPLGRKLALRVLTAASFTVVVEATAEEALRRARAEPPDAILSDLRMPGMNGFELCRRIRQDPRLAHIPVVLTSSTSGDELDHALAREVGAQAIVPRTSDLLEALAALRSALGRG